jgi:peptidoglycan hydrolase CwlO-like protein
MLMVLVSLSLWAVIGSPAPAQDAQEEIQQKLDELDRVQASEAPLRSEIDAMNAKVDQLIGQESQLRQQEAVVQRELDAKQAELDEATAELNEQKARLGKLRAQLKAATAALEQLLVEIYKSGDPDITSIILRSTDWSDLLSRTEYLNRVHDYDEEVVTQVRGLRDEVTVLVNQLTETHARIKAARDEVLAKERQLASARAQIQAQHSQLVAARAERQGALEAILKKERELEGDLFNIPPQAGRAALVNGEAIPPPNAPLAIRAVIEAANEINDLPYVWGGGHGSFESSGYDCSGAVSFALHGGGLLSSPLDSTAFQVWGAPGGGNWITVYANSGHAWAMIAGLRWDTGGPGGGNGPRWSTVMRTDIASFIPRHPPGF